MPPDGSRLPLLLQQVARQMPRYPLLKVPTPVQAWDFPGRGMLWIKRDDLTHPGYGGNKVRKLEFILGHALAKKYRRIVTFGALGTHHGLATAFFARQCELQTTVILFDQPVTPAVLHTQARLQQLGAELWHRHSLWRCVLSYSLEAPLRHPLALRVFAGGSGFAGALALVLAAIELAEQQAREHFPIPDRIFVAVGSSATLAGLATGCALLGWNTRVVGVRVAQERLGPWSVCNRQTVEAQINLLRQHLALWGIRVPAVHFDFDDTEFGSGYGVATADAEAAAQLFADTVACPLDSTYTAKTFAAVLKCRQRHPQAQLLYWHTLNSADTQHWNSAH